MTDLFAQQLKALRVRSLDRHLREIGSAQGPTIEIVGQVLVNFSSNDYLGLANDPRLREAASAAIGEFGVGAGASRLISGTQSPHLRLESALAKWKENASGAQLQQRIRRGARHDPGPSHEE
jgi:7-keto-8-aminopelargonate synthetase-like enzyme